MFNVVLICGIFKETGEGSFDRSDLGLVVCCSERFGVVVGLLWLFLDKMCGVIHLSTDLADVLIYVVAECVAAIALNLATVCELASVVRVIITFGVIGVGSLELVNCWVVADAIE